MDGCLLQVLNAVAAGAEPGDIDDAIDLILPVVDEELFGGVGEAKEATQFSSSYREAKTCQSYKTYELALRLVTFREVDKVVAAVR